MYVLFYDYRFTYAETSLHFRNETNIAYDIFTVDEFYFTSVLLRNFGSMFVKEIFFFTVPLLLCPPILLSE